MRATTHSFPSWAMLLAVTLPCCVSAAETYTVDPKHSNIHFSVSHFWFTTTHGRFDKLSGQVALDRAAKTGMMDITIAADSINTGIDLRDKNLRSANFFDVAKFPNVSYQSSALRFNGDTPVSVEGNLTLLGVTRPVTLTISTFECELPATDQKEVCKAVASTRIKRSDFGMKYALPLVGDEITMKFEVAAYK
ncbi:MAG: YceI family protein [Gallionellaceae bacterium]|nr:YceI family protein [Gallionellaceae bacterium]